VLLGLTSGYRDAGTQQRLYEADQARGGRRVLPPHESRHVSGTALDVRPVEGAGWLSRHGGRYGLYRVYDNEWWHFEHCPDGPPARRPHPATVARWPTPDSD
jgi:zinc D-Ala-D-Ala carboxypeptidase